MGRPLNTINTRSDKTHERYCVMIMELNWYVFARNKINAFNLVTDHLTRIKTYPLPLFDKTGLFQYGPIKIIRR